MLIGKFNHPVLDICSETLIVYKNSFIASFINIPTKRRRGQNFDDFYTFHMYNRNGIDRYITE